MALVELSPAQLAALRATPSAVEIAAFNAPSQIAVAGRRADVGELVAAVEARGLLAKMIKSSVAGHCRLVDPILDELTDGLRELDPPPPEVAFYGTVLEDPRASPAFDAAYWAANIRRPVRFAQAVAAAAGDGHRTFVEVSPHPVAAPRAARQGPRRGHRRPGGPVHRPPLRRRGDARSRPACRTHASTARPCARPPGPTPG